MIVTEQKPLGEILEGLKEYNNIFLVGCGECAATCKTGGEPELLRMKEALEKEGKAVLGYCLPQAPCVTAKLKAEFARNMPLLRQAEVILVLACGLGVQSVKDNDRLGHRVLPGSNSLFAAVVDGQGNFREKCSLCGECVLAETAGICPATLCPKALLNGPCGGVDKGKCEVDKDKDCVWVLIYHQMQKDGSLETFQKIRPAKDHLNTKRPHQLIVGQKA
jgi:ferredoxin